MKKRQSIIQQFSTFLGFASASKQLSHDWISESELEQSIKQHIEACSEKTAEQWALYFLTVLQREPDRFVQSTRPSIASKHLSAYLQETCYQAAQKVQKQFQSVQYQYAIEDLFQIGSLLVHQPAKLFRSFKSEYTYSSLESYAKTAIFRFIGNTIYAQDIEAKREKFSDYGLLRDLSQKELKEALAASGITDQQIDSYCLTRQCFNTVCQPQQRHGSRTLEAPNPAELNHIATCYNQRHAQFNLPVVQAASVQAMLSFSIQAARSYRTKRILTLDQDERVADSTPTPWERMIQAEERSQLEALIAQLFNAVPATGQTLLKLWLGLDLTQTEIATVMRSQYPEIQKQYQVARQLGKYHRNFFKDFLQQSRRIQPERGLIDDKEIELIQESLAECLQSYCQRCLVAEFVQFSQQYHAEPRFFSFTERSSKSVRSLDREQGLIQAFEQHLEQHLKLSPKSLQAVHAKIEAVVLEWQRSTRYELQKGSAVNGSQIVS